MEWVERLNQSMNYIEEHLTGEIDYEQLGRTKKAILYAVKHVTVTKRNTKLKERLREI